MVAAGAANVAGGCEAPARRLSARVRVKAAAALELTLVFERVRGTLSTIPLK